MSEIKKYQCPSCGGNLTDDSEKHLYRCTSCGSTYDYDYFREERLHGMGDTYLSRGECKAAIDAYKLILKNNPHDFLALRGLMLAAAYMKDMNDFTRVGESKHFSYNSKLVSETVASASEEDKEYFAEFARIYADKKLLIDCNKEIESLRRERKRTDADTRLTDDSRYDYYFKNKNGMQSPIGMFILIWCLVGFYGGSCIAASFAIEDADGFEVFLLIFGILILLIGAIINFVKVYPRMKIIKEIDADIRELQVESDQIGGKIKKLENEVERLTTDISKSIHEFIKRDRQIMSSSVKEQVSEISKIKKHQCPSCGGSLRIDRDKQMYHCSFCGSTYDYEYFREEQIHDAGETYLSRGEFMATADAYEFMLKKDPHDFLALRGLMLTAAHLTNMSELEQEDKLEEFSYDSKTVSRVIENASEEDREYFTEFGKVYSDRKKLADCTEEIEALWEKKSKINSVIAHNNIERANYYDEGKQSPKTSFIVFWIVDAFLLTMTILLVIELIREFSSSGMDSIGGTLGTVSAFAALSIGCGVYNYVVNYSKARKIKNLDKANAKLYVESGRMDEKMRDLENESANLLNALKRSIHDFVKKDRLIMRDRIK